MTLPRVGNYYFTSCETDTAAENEFLPVPESWVFPEVAPADSETYQADQPATFTVDFDDEVGGDTAQGFDDGNENDSAVSTPPSNP